MTMAMMAGKKPGCGPSTWLQNPSCAKPITANTTANTASTSGTICFVPILFI